MTSILRELSEDDATGLIDLWRTTWTVTYGPNLGGDVLSGMLADLDKHGMNCLLPGKGERGYCIASAEYLQGSIIVAERGNTAYLWGLYVLPSNQRRGLGSRLLFGAVSRLKKARKLEIWVLKSNAAALAFWRKKGFTEMEWERMELLGNAVGDAIVMEAAVVSLKDGFFNDNSRIFR
jgi:ribosomal protein S18 acetylase RimI-like enzyme